MADRRESENPKVFVLKRELSEVYLLLDNISTNPDNKLPATEAGVPIGLDKEWLKKVCDIDWPPDGTTDKAKEASLLIRAKDFLNNLAKPASGASIAFTLLATQDESRVRRHSDEGGEHVPSRSSLARSAYPDYVPEAKRFRTMQFWLSLFLVACLLLTSALTWNVAYGNAAIRQLSAAQASFDSASLKVEATEATEATEAPKTETANPKQGAQITQVVVKTATDLCATAKKEPSKADASLSGYVSLSQLQACEIFEQADYTRTSARIAVVRWLHPIAPDKYLANHKNEDYLAVATARASIWGNGVLPFLFGLLGAGAAVVRSLSRKMKLSLLTPRDSTLSPQQLALGAVTGACIGLFMAQPGSAETTAGTALGPVALTGSALSFVAGFGVDAVFETIDGIIRRIFNIPSPPGAQGAAVADKADARPEMIDRAAQELLHVVQKNVAAQVQR
ncbi:MAG: hypothetical protein ABI810_12935 [Sphingomonas bacterium]